ncbi:hypothetical protein BDK51DRAFT_32824 [Blyttiomyces helicus]|uniref:Uncharacterized protein n=1 Tax=Blyttiomyces helicus TaxID=388810 RepID=A0A4P9WB96_9FUNG|nr:hypothetical protein BDK51DRAFT_32824 [Blyttiomyces helicus]|eukprot:RKO88865.1 hypothetical protein BDK51DRAFT_32824 [Blyttiomyces helicus]
MNEEPIPVVVNLDKGSISTKESTTKFTSLVASGSNDVSFTTETTKQTEELFPLKQIDEQIEKKSNRVSKVSKVVLAVLFAMMGSTAIQFHENAATNAVSCPAIPDFKPLIPPAPLNFSNYEQLALHKPLYSKATLQLKMEKNKAEFFHGELGGENAQTKQILKDIQHQKEKAARDEKMAKELLEQAKQVITNLKRELKDAEQATKYWQDRSDSHFTMQKISEDSVLKTHFQSENAKKTIVSITEEMNRLTGNYTEQLSDAKTQLSNIINKNDANQKFISDLEGLIERLSRINQILDDENVAMSKYYLEQIENVRKESFEKGVSTTKSDFEAFIIDTNKAHIANMTALHDRNTALTRDNNQMRSKLNSQTALTQPEIVQSARNNSQANLEWTKPSIIATQEPNGKWKYRFDTKKVDCS